jgi:hypothetical protein
LPWAIFLPWVVYELYSQRSGEKRRQVLLLFVWFVFLFLFFTLSKGKKDNYLLPLYPAAAIGVGIYLDSFFDSGEERRRTIGKLWVPMGLVTFLFLVAWFIILLKPFKSFPKELETYLHIAIWPLFFIAFGGVLSLGFLMRTQKRLSIFFLIAALIVAEVCVSVVIPPQFNPLRSMKPFCRQILERMAPTDELKIWKFQSTGLLYYTGRQIEQIRKVDRFLQVYRSPRRVFMVAEEEDFKRLRGQVDVSFHVVEREKVGHQILWLVSNQGVQ